MSIERRIADIIAAHETSDYHMYTWSCDCGADFHDADTHSAHVAEIIVTELGLTEETSAAFDFSESVRYTTAWEKAG